MSVKCPVNCGKKFTTEAFAEAHADEAHDDWRTPRRKGWVTPFGFADFTKPVTYDEAYSEMKRIAEQVIPKLKANNDKSQ